MLRRKTIVPSAICGSKYSEQEAEALLRGSVREECGAVYPLGEPRLEFDVQRHAVLLAMADAVCLRHEPGELFRGLAPQLRTVVAFDFVTFARFDSSRKIMKLFLWEGEEWPREPLEIAVEDAAVGSVWRNQKALSIDDLSTEKRFGPELHWLRQHDLQSYCVLPLTTIQEKLGALGFGRKRTHAFRSEDVQFLQSVAEMAALSVDTTMAQPTLLEECARLRLLLEVGAPHIRVSDLHQAVASILESMQKWASRDYVGVYLYDESSEALRLHMPDPELAEKFVPQGLAPIEGTLAGQAFRSRQRVVLDHSGLTGSPFSSVKRGTELVGPVSLSSSTSFGEGSVRSATGGAPRGSPILPARCRTAGTGSGNGGACV
jgi:putative methionine-R-sulfoxide reductase with GAF domain